MITLYIFNASQENETIENHKCINNNFDDLNSFMQLIVEIEIIC